MITNVKTTTLILFDAHDLLQNHVFSPFTSTGSIKIHIILSVFFSPFPFVSVVCSISINNVEFNFQ